MKYQIPQDMMQSPPVHKTDFIILEEHERIRKPTAKRVYKPRYEYKIQFKKHTHSIGDVLYDLQSKLLFYVIDINEEYAIAWSINRRKNKLKKMSACFILYEKATAEQSVLKTVVHAKPMTNKEFCLFMAKQYSKRNKKYLSEETLERDKIHISSGYFIEDGYKVTYEGGYTSWSPKEVFEKTYHEFEKISVIRAQ